MKTRVYNLIILDESGSMDCVRKSTIAGCNETINTIRAAQKKFYDSQEHFVSVYVFQSDGEVPSRYLFKNLMVDEVHHITAEDYVPYGCTPLYDAVGSTLTDLKHKVNGMPHTVGSVTIITDGYENSSRRYSLDEVARMIAALKELGWSFNFIGANIDVNQVAEELNIDNRMAFEQTESGMQRMCEQEQEARMSYYSRVDSCQKEEKGTECFADKMKRAAKRYFEED